jgi:hypothetical protein
MNSEPEATPQILYRSFSAALPPTAILLSSPLMQSKATTVQQYLAELPADRRSALQSVRAVILKNLDPLYEEGMQYGMIGYYVPHRVYPAGYHCDPKQPLPFVALASQKNYMAFYLGCLYGDDEHDRWFLEAWARSGKKLDMGKSCLRFKKLEDLALDVIGASIRRVPALTFIQHYESVIKSLRCESTGKTAEKPRMPKKRIVNPTPAKRRL